MSETLLSTIEAMKKKKKKTRMPKTVLSNWLKEREVEFGKGKPAYLIDRRQSDLCISAHGSKYYQSVKSKISKIVGTQ